MENNSTLPPSPVWPTHWPKNAFALGPSAMWLAIVVGGLLIGLIVGTIAVAVILGENGAPPITTAEMLGIQGIAEAFAIPAGWWFLPIVAQFSLRDLGFARPTIGTIGIIAGGVIVATLAVQLMSGLTDSLTHAPHLQELTTAFLQRHDPLSVVLFFVSGCIIAPIAEETLFRLFLFNLGMRYMGFWWSAILSSIVFGYGHFDVYNAPTLAAVGLVLCCVYYYSRNAFASMITHGLFNAITLTALLFFPAAVHG